MAALARLSEWYSARVAAAMRLLYSSMVRLPTDVDGQPICCDDIDAAMTWLDDEAGNLIALMETVAHGVLRHRAWQLADQLRGYFFVHRDAVRWLTSGTIGLDAARRAGDRRAEAVMHQTLGQAHWSAGTSWPWRPTSAGSPPPPKRMGGRTGLPAPQRGPHPR